MTVHQLVLKHGLGIKVARSGETFIVLEREAVCHGNDGGKYIFRCRSENGKEFNLCCFHGNDYEFVPAL